MRILNFNYDVLSSPLTSPVQADFLLFSSLLAFWKLHVSLYDDMMILQSPDDIEDVDGNKKVSLMEFRQQYRELSQWLTNVQRVAHKSLVSQMLSEKYLAQVSTCRVDNIEQVLGVPYAIGIVPFRTYGMVYKAYIIC